MSANLAPQNACALSPAGPSSPMSEDQDFEPNRFVFVFLVFRVVVFVPVVIRYGDKRDVAWWRGGAQNACDGKSSCESSRAMFSNGSP